MSMAFRLMLTDKPIFSHLYCTVIDAVKRISTYIIGATKAGGDIKVLTSVTYSHPSLSSLYI